jgi:hypothetical protein
VTDALARIVPLSNDSVASLALSGLIRTVGGRRALAARTAVRELPTISGLVGEEQACRAGTGTRT